MASFSPELRVALGSALMLKDQDMEASAQLRYACLLNPQSTDTLADLAWKLATDPNPARRNGPVAVKLAGQACTVAGSHQTTPPGHSGCCLCRGRAVPRSNQDRRAGACFGSGLGRFHRRGANATAD